MDLAGYQEKKEKLQAAQRAMAAAARELSLDRQAGSLEEDAALLAKEKFELVVVGEFSRGKSTFINAMLGRTILPVSKNPTTTVISKIVYGGQPAYTLHYKTGQPDQPLTEAEFSRLVAPPEVDESDEAELIREVTGQQAKLAAIDYATVAYPLPFCQDQVEVIDTPGTNDLNTGRIEITYNYLNQADAAIFVMAANQPMTDSEASFLEERILGNQIADVFVVMNYKDALHSPEEEAEVAGYVRDKLAERLPGQAPLPIFMVSSKQALLYRRAAGGEVLRPAQLLRKPATLEETGFPAFEEALGHFLSEEKGRAKLVKYAQRALAAAAAASRLLADQRELAVHSADDLRLRYAAMQPEFQRTKHRAAEAVRQLRNQLAAAEHTLAYQCDAALGDIRQAALQAVDSYHGEMRAKKIVYAVEKEVTPQQKKFLETIRQQQEEILQQNLAAAARSLQKIWADMDIRYQAVFDLSTDTGHALSLELEAGPTADERDEKATDWGIAGVIGGIVLGVHLLPALAIGSAVGFLGHWLNDSEGSYIGGKIKASAREQLRQQYDHSQAQLAKDILAQYRQNSTRLCEALENEVRGRVEDMEQQLQAVIAAKEKKEADSEQEIHRLQAIGQRLAKIKEDLAEVLA